MGAAIGGGLAGLTAFGTSWFNLRMARLQHKVQEAEATRQRRFESLRERREPRTQAYAEFLDVSHQVEEVLGNIEARPTASTRLRELRTLSARVAVTGPQAVADAADEVVASLASWLLANAARGVTVGDTMRVEASLKEFTEEARAALEDDGNDPEPPVSPPGR
ncbi:hypothetical protein OIE73_28595 [Streptomyces hirsutus]|uniref:Uncharacterized protein n=1 Tax=Streptomyces hirsutus TaxID=35620 RepID=A0ABZ1GVS8_9ACTN|nr:hypothetical protein [Streptomyces hirsutus]WSD09306.1 hypothetical protein OIE73_28595 [Streptomyces hirsutus]